MGPLVSFALLVVGLYATWHSWSLGLWADGVPGVGLFPFIFASLLTLFMAVELGAARLAMPNRAALLALRANRRFQAYFAGLVLYALTLSPLGFVLSTAICFVLIMRVGEGLGWKQIVPVTGLSLVVTHVVLQRLLGVPLPAGVFL